MAGIFALKISSDDSGEEIRSPLQMTQEELMENAAVDMLIEGMQEHPRDKKKIIEGLKTLMRMLKE